jgi:hypothetical protein
MHCTLAMRIGDYVIESFSRRWAAESQPTDGVLDAVHVLLPRRAKIVMVDRAFEIACALETIKHPEVRVYECGLDPQPWIAVSDVDDPLQVLADALERRYPALAAVLVESIEDEDIILLEAEPAFSLAGGMS